mmetsp:Transcript_4199/g.9413  ORF Transcript_4199/g.9413 Transcript_4199/m.9413 type:complete len:281 (+) Transcript_4199:130-972(+)
MKHPGVAMCILTVLSVSAMKSALFLGTTALAVTDAFQMKASYGLSNSVAPRGVLSGSSLFGSSERRRRQRTERSALQSSIPDGAEVSTETSPGVNVGNSSFLRAVDEFGMSLKPRALQAYEKSLTFNANATSVSSTPESSVVNGRVESLLYRAKSNIMWMLYIGYRGYRGFFVILPAVFREVYRQLEESDLVLDAYEDEDAQNGADDSSEADQSMRMRTRLTISVLSMILTASYVVSGLIRVLGMFVKTFTRTTSVESSLEAAADEVVSNEELLRRQTER